MSTYNNLTDYQQLLHYRKHDNNFKICVSYYTKLVGEKSFFPAEAYNKIGSRIFPMFMLQFCLALLISQVLYFVLRPLRQPKVVSNVLAGIILGPSVLGYNEKLWRALFPLEEVVVVNTISTMGCIYFMFIVSVKMDKARILKTVRSSWSISATCLFLPFMITMALTSLLYHYLPGLAEGPFRYFFSTNLSQTFFAVVAHGISELNLLTSELGQLVMSCSILSELFSWFNLVLSTLIKGQDRLPETAISSCALICFIFFIVRPGVKWIIRRTPEGKPVKEIYILAILILPLVTGVLSDIVGLSILPGSLMIGLVIPPGPPLGSAIVEKGELMMQIFFMPFFYIHLGQLTKVHSIKDWKAFAILETIIIVQYFARLAASLLSMKFFKISLRNAILFGFILNMKGVVELLLVMLWRMEQYVDDQTLTTIVLSHTVVTAIVTPLISIYYKPNSTRRIQAFASHDMRTRTLAMTPMNGELRILCGIHYEDTVHSIISLLTAINPTELSPVCAYVVHLVDLVGRAETLSAPYKTQKRRSKENPTDRIMRAVTNHTKSSTVALTSQPYTIIAPYRTMHESICRLAEDRFIPLIILPFHKSLGIQDTATSLHQLNLNVQAYAPCSVGILVQSGLPRYLSSTQFSYYHVAVFFLGGDDDREAMTLVSRMADHPSVSITVFRIDLKGNQEEEDGDDGFRRELDEYAMNVFRERNDGNARVECRELMANDSEEMMGAIRSIENIYDLAIVGQRRGAGSKFEQEMKSWIEYEELGIFGDMLASVDFCGRMKSVLVIRCAEN